MIVSILRTTDHDFEQRFEKLECRAVEGRDAGLREAVTTIIDDVRTRGDDALIELSVRFDERSYMTVSDIEVSRDAIDQAWSELPKEIKLALERAAKRIRAFHRVQKTQLVNAHLDEGEGIRAGLIVRPLDRVGIYVPGGTASYPSTVLMNAIPAKVAGVDEVFMTTPARGGEVPGPVLAAARIAGVDRVFSVGGAQAVAALANGTTSMPRVRKIVGPGNAYVQEAKRQVYGDVDIDQIAGPSEVLIVADDSADPHVIAADLLAQAEHDARAAAIVVTWDSDLATNIVAELDRQCEDLPRTELATEAIRARGGVILARDKREAFALANRYAPEHLGLAMEHAEEELDEVLYAGAIFLGHHTPEALGDYNAGINHVLPTGGTARFGSPLSVHDFVRRMSILSVGRDALERIGPDAIRLARVEGLEGHARAVESRWRSS